MFVQRTGAPHSDAMVTAALDLTGASSPNVTLFQCLPGFAFGDGECFVPNIAHTSDRAFQLLIFLGKLMGYSIRNAVRQPVAMPLQ